MNPLVHLELKGWPGPRVRPSHVSAVTNDGMRIYIYLYGGGEVIWRAPSNEYFGDIEEESVINQLFPNDSDKPDNLHDPFRGGS